MEPFSPEHGSRGKHASLSTHCVLVVFSLLSLCLVAESVAQQVTQPSPPADVQQPLNRYAPPDFFANPNINITPLQSPPRLERNPDEGPRGPEG